MTFRPNTFNYHYLVEKSKRDGKKQFTSGLIHPNLITVFEQVLLVKAEAARARGSKKL